MLKKDKNEGSRHKKRDHNFYDKLWENVIKIELDGLAKENGIVLTNNNVKNAIWDAYVLLNKHCSSTYMLHPDNPIDRHKISACYIYSIIAVRPMKVNESVPVWSPTFFVNERLAVTVGCSILVHYLSGLLTQLRDSPGWIGNEEEKSKIDQSIKEIRKRGIQFTKYVGHGDSYVSNAYRALYFDYAENRYDIPMLALMLFDWECHSIDRHVHHQLLKFIDDRKNKIYENKRLTIIKVNTLCN